MESVREEVKQPCLHSGEAQIIKPLKPLELKPVKKILTEVKEI